MKRGKNTLVQEDKGVVLIKLDSQQALFAFYLYNIETKCIFFVFNQQEGR